MEPKDSRQWQTLMSSPVSVIELKQGWSSVHNVTVQRLNQFNGTFYVKPPWQVKCLTFECLHEAINADPFFSSTN